MDVYVTRHGARIDNGPDCDPDWLRVAGHGRADDPQLSPSGEQAARELAARLLDTPLACVVSSPFVRCMQTAELVAAPRKLPVLVEPGICEILTIFPPGILSDTELQARFPNVDPSYVPVVPRAELCAESSDGVAARRAGACAKCVREHIAGPILFVGHGASCLGIVEAFGGQGYIGYTSFTHSVLDGLKWRIVGVQGDVSHLSDQVTARGSAW